MSTIVNNEVIVKNEIRTPTFKENVRFILSRDPAGRAGSFTYALGPRQ